MSDQTEGDQTEAELERTREVVAATMAEQIATNEEAVADADVTSEAAAAEAPKGNASREEWVAYATANGYVIDDEWTRDDIRGLFAEES